MLNQDNFYYPLFPKYDNSNYGNCNSYFIPYKYDSKAIKACNYCLSLEVEKNNSKAFNILTDKNNLVSNLNAFNKLISEDSKINDFKEYNAPKMLQNINNHSKILDNKNYSKINIQNYIPLSNRIKIIESQSQNKDNIYKKNNCLKKKFSSIALSCYNESIKPDNNNSTYYNLNNNSFCSYNQHFMKHNCHSLFKKDLHIINDTLNTDISTKKGYMGNNQEKEEEKILFNSNENIDTQYIRKDNNTYNSNFNSNKSKIYEGLDKNTTLNKTHHNNSNIVKIAKNSKSNNNNYPNQNLSFIYYPTINRNISYSKIENIDVTNKLINKCDKNENKKKINLVLNKIKKLNPISSPNLKYNFDNKNNHSFYEIKSLSKELSQKNIKTKMQIINNNEVINSVFKNKKEINSKLSNKKAGNNSTNIIILHKNDNKKDKNINLSKNCLKKKEKYIVKREISKKSNENINKSEINYNNFKEIKENINTNNLNINNINYYTYNNNLVVEKKLNKNKKITINLDNINYDNSDGIKKQTQISKNSINNFENNKEYLIDLNKRKIIRHIPSGNILHKNNSKKLRINKINSNHFSFLPSKISSNPKKMKKCFNQKNIIQLNTIINKIYKEDFLFKEKDENKNNSKQNLKPQISVRIVLFGNKEPEKEKYFLVNIFYSENIRDKPDESESDL